MNKKQLEKKIKTLEFELEDCRADLEEIRYAYYGEEDEQ